MSSFEVTKPAATRHVKALFYGPFGHGKTFLCGTAALEPRTSPCLFLDFEGGEQTLAGLDIDMFRVRTWTDYNNVYNALANGETEYRSVVVDSISETNVFAVLNILDATKAMRSDPTAGPWGPDAVQLQDYGKVQIQMRRFIRAFRDLPMHVFMTAQSKDVNDPKEGFIKKPALIGQMAEEMPGIMDVVAYVAIQTKEDNKPERVLLLQNYPKYRVKVRTPWGAEGFPNELPDPTIGKLLDVLKVPQLTTKAA